MDEKGTKVYLLRHGETQNYNGVFKYNGHIDVDVTAKGHEQLEIQAERLKAFPVKAIYASDLKRSVNGAEKIADTLSIEVCQDPRLREINAGRWEGLSYQEVFEKYPDEAIGRFSDIVNYRIPGGGENLLDVQRRAGEAMSEIIGKHKDEEVAVVAHGGINRIILCDAMKLGLENILRIEQDFGCLNIVEYHETGGVVRLMNLRP